MQLEAVVDGCRSAAAVPFVESVPISAFLASEGSRQTLGAVGEGTVFNAAAGSRIYTLVGVSAPQAHSTGIAGTAASYCAGVRGALRSGRYVCVAR